MAFTREFIRSAAKESGVEIPKELEDTLIQEHISARDAYAGEQVKTALAENQPEPAPKVKDTPEYKALKKEFDDYKTGVSEKETKAAKESAARAYYQEKGVTGSALDIAMRGSGEEIAALEIGEDGKVKDFKALDGLIAGTFKDLIATTTTIGAPTSTPPANTGGGITKKDIYKKDEKGRYIMDATERQNALIKMMSEAQT